MPGFEYDPSRGKFRAYLKTIALRTIFRRNRQNRAEVAPGDDAGPEATVDDPTIDSLREAEWKQYHLRLAMRTVEKEFSEPDRRAFEL